MRILATIAAATLFMFLLVSAPAFSQDAGDRPQAQDEKAKDKDKDKETKEKAPKPDEKTAKPDEGKRDASRPEMRQQDNREHPEAAQPQGQRPEEQRPEEHAGRNDQHPMAARGKHIPDDKFRSSFGRGHTFRVQRTQIVNQAQPVIVYGGYSFQLVDAWPAEWSYDDDCYIDYVDGEYFLFDALHPGIRIAVFVVE